MTNYIMAIALFSLFLLTCYNIYPQLALSIIIIIPLLSFVFKKIPINDLIIKNKKAVMVTYGKQAIIINIILGLLI